MPQMPRVRRRIPTVHRQRVRGDQGWHRRRPAGFGRRQTSSFHAGSRARGHHPPPCRNSDPRRLPRSPSQQRRDPRQRARPPTSTAPLASTRGRRTSHVGSGNLTATRTAQIYRSCSPLDTAHRTDRDPASRNSLLSKVHHVCRRIRPEAASGAHETGSGVPGMYLPCL